MNNSKKAISFFTAITIVIALFSCLAAVSAKTYGLFTYSVEGDKVSIIRCSTSASGTIQIPSAIEHMPVADISDFAFYDCKDITKLVIPTSVTRIGNSAFENCSGLAGVTIPSSVKKIGVSAFSNCTALYTVNLPSDVVIMQKAFNNTAIYNTPSKWQNGVLYIGKHLIKSQSDIKNLTVKSGTFTIADYAIDSCKSLENISLPSSLTRIGSNAFEECIRLTSLTIPNSVKSIGDYAFEYCIGLSSVIIPKSVTNIGTSIFCNCLQLESIKVDSANSYFKDINGVLFNKSATKLYCYPIGNEAKDYSIPATVTEIGKNAFSYAPYLCSVAVPNGVQSIGVSAFYECIGLSKLNLPSSITNIGAFSFNNCKALKEISIDSNNKNYSSYQGILYNKSKTEIISVPQGISGNVYIAEGINEISNSLFSSCENLKSINLPVGITAIRDSAFYNCTNLVSVSIPNTVKIIEDSAFYNCYKLHSVCLPDSLDMINEFTFTNCNNLKHLSIPKSIKIIEADAFKNCDSLDNVVYGGTMNDWQNIELSDNAIYFEKPVFIYNSENKFWENEFFIESLPTCIKYGVKYIRCSLCEEKTEITHTKTLPHTKSDNFIITAPTCTKEGYTTYVCSACGNSFKDDFIKLKDHTLKTIITKATATKNGKIDQICEVCKKTISSKTIYAAKNIKLSSTSVVYNGKVRTPTVTVKDSRGITISKNNYTVTYQRGRKEVGIYNVTVKFKGNYAGTKTLTFNIIPKSTTIKKLTPGKKMFSITWAKQTTGITGYQIQYSTSSKFTKSNTITVKGRNYTVCGISKLSAKKTYYVRIRTYKTIKGNYLLSSWSSYKSVKTK